jgi:hypothetical protein
MTHNEFLKRIWIATARCGGRLSVRRQRISATMICAVLLLTGCSKKLEAENAKLSSELSVTKLQVAKLSADLESLAKQNGELSAKFAAKEADWKNVLAKMEDEKKADREKIDAQAKALALTNAVAEAKALAEAEALKNAVPEELKSFMREARRMVTALSTGTSYIDFRQKLGDLTASAKETLLVVTETKRRSLIQEYMLALLDANGLWAYTIDSGSDNLRLTLLEGTTNEYHPADFPPSLGDRWNLEFTRMVKLYALSDEIVTRATGKSFMTRRAMSKCLDLAAEKFRELESLK